jgi:hypothetical protein
MTLNVIKWTSKQMLLLILLVKEHEESKGNKCILLIPVQAKMLLINIGLCSEKDFVLESDFEAYFERENWGNVNLIVHHFDVSLNSYPQILGSIADKVEKLFVSYFADGYVNSFHNMVKAIELLDANPHIAPLNAYSFDAINQDYSQLNYAKHEIVSSELLHDVYSRYEFEGLLKDNLESLGKGRAASARYLFLVMRPWGSESFHQGKFALKYGVESLFEIVFDITEKVKTDINEELVILYRGDDRDKNLMRDFKKLLIKKGFVCLDLVDCIPEFLTLDSYVYFFNKYVSKNFSTAVFDSTTSLPFIKLGLGDKHYVGASKNIIEYHQLNKNMANIVSNKVALLKRHIDKVKVNDYQETELAPSFFAFEK